MMQSQSSLSISQVDAFHANPVIFDKTIRQAAFGYMEVDYSQVRRHSANGDLGR